MILGVLLLAATINRTFADLYDSVYGRADLVVSGTGEDSLPGSALKKVESTNGVDEAVGRIIGIFTLIEGDGTAPPDASNELNVAGQDPDAADVTDSETVAGREPEGAREIALQQSWADRSEEHTSELQSR